MITNITIEKAIQEMIDSNHVMESCTYMYLDKLYSFKIKVVKK